jgi:hypothetical protein
VIRIIGYKAFNPANVTKVVGGSPGSLSVEVWTTDGMKSEVLVPRDRSPGYGTALEYVVAVLNDGLKDA